MPSSRFSEPNARCSPNLAELACATVARRRLIVVVLLIVRIALIAFGLSTLPENGGHGLGNDANRFQQIASTTGTPYEDFDVEVPPVALWTIDVLDGGSGRALAERLAIMMLVCDILVALILWTTWGPDVGLRYWILGTPLAFFIYLRLDLLSVVLAVAGAALARRRHEMTSGFATAVGVFVKLWPVVLVPLLWAMRRWRAAAVGIGLTVAGTLAWVTWVGITGPRQVVTYRGATGWEVESPVGSFLWIVARWQPRIEEGALRVGTVPTVVRIALYAAIAGSMVWITIRCREQPSRAEGFGMAAAVGSILVFSTLLSHQYVAWLLPWVAIASDRRLTLWTMMAAIAASTVILYTSTPIEAAPIIARVVLLVRNVAIVVVYVLALHGLGSRASDAVPAALQGKDEA
jgi:Glycosyltransferase family 87